jgi:hypothetical protein
VTLRNFLGRKMLPCRRELVEDIVDIRLKPENIKELRLSQNRRKFKQYFLTTLG